MVYSKKAACSRCLCSGGGFGLDAKEKKKQAIKVSDKNKRRKQAIKNKR